MGKRKRLAKAVKQMQHIEAVLRDETDLAFILEAAEIHAIAAALWAGNIRHKKDL